MANNKRGADCFSFTKDYNFKNSRGKKSFLLVAKKTTKPLPPPPPTDLFFHFLVCLWFHFIRKKKSKINIMACTLKYTIEINKLFSCKAVRKQ